MAKDSASYILEFSCEIKHFFMCFSSLVEWRIESYNMQYLLDFFGSIRLLWHLVWAM